MNARGLRKRVRKYIAEFCATSVLNLLCALACDNLFAKAAALAVLIYTTADISGGHLNPAVTFVFFLIGQTDPVDSLMYMLSQCTGCIVSSIAVKSTRLVNQPCVSVEDQKPHDIFSWELFGTLGFLFPLFTVVWLTQHKDGYGSTGPLIIGLSFYMVVAACLNTPALMLNPAVVIGSVVTYDACREAGMIYYVLAEIVGSIICAVLFLLAYGCMKEAWYAAYARKFSLLLSNTFSAPLPTEASGFRAKVPSSQVICLDEAQGILSSERFVS